MPVFVVYHHVAIEKREASSMKPAIIDIPGIGPAAAEALAEHRIRTLAALARASVEKISSIPGFSEARAARVIAAAAELNAASGTPPAATDEGASAKREKAAGKGKKDKKKGKGKDKKKDKKKGKGKGKKKGKK
jgi:NAD-dependent DNA ligase